MNEVIFEYIEVFYNRKRLHSSNDYFSVTDLMASHPLITERIMYFKKYAGEI